MGSVHLNRPVDGLVAFGNGYLLGGGRRWGVQLLGPLVRRQPRQRSAPGADHRARGLRFLSRRDALGDADQAFAGRREHPLHRALEPARSGYLGDGVVDARRRRIWSPVAAPACVPGARGTSPTSSSARRSSCASSSRFRIFDAAVHRAGVPDHDVAAPARRIASAPALRVRATPGSSSGTRAGGQHVFGSRARSSSSWNSNQGRRCEPGRKNERAAVGR